MKMEMKPTTFVFVNFLVSATADIVLNDLANRYNIFSSLKPYFREKTILGAAFLAGLTVAVSTAVLLPLSNVLLGFYVPSTFNQLVLFLALSYPLGFAIDKAIEKIAVFGPTLVPFYEKYGSVNSGAMAFIISLFMSFLLQKYLIPIL